MDTGYYIAGNNIYGSTDYPQFHVRDGRIHGRRGDTGYRIQGERIFGPDGYSGYYLREGHILGPSKTLPWAPHADGSKAAGPGF